MSHVKAETPDLGEPVPSHSPSPASSQASFIVAPVPVICTAKVGNTEEQVPAVKASHPTAGFALFPLNRLEVGDVWFGEAQAQRWNVEPLKGGWEEALTKFKALVRYPSEFLHPMLEALRRQTFLDDTPLSWTQWSHFCKTTSPKLYAVATCYRCATPRCLSMRLLNDVRRTLDYFQCDSLGTRCGESRDRIHDSYIDYSPPYVGLGPPSPPPE